MGALKNGIKKYTLPVVAAGIVHAVGAWFVLVEWSQGVELKDVVEPTVIQASLVQAPRPAPKPPVVIPPQPEPVPAKTPIPVEKEPEPEPEPEEEKEEIDEEKALEEARRAAEARKLQELRSEASEAFENLIAEEGDVTDQELPLVAQYRQGIHLRIIDHWSRPPSARNGMKAELLVELIPTGELVGVSLILSSGNEAFDRSAEQAVRRARRFEVPQRNALFEEHFRRIHLIFQPDDLLR